MNDQVSPEPIFQMATAYWVSKTLMAAVEFELFTKISNRSVTLEELQKVLGMTARPADVFATALVSLGLLNTSKDGRGGRLFSNSPLSATFLDRNKPSYMGDIISMFDKRLYNMWDKLPQCLLTNKPAGGSGEEMFGQARSNQATEQMQKFTHAMYGVSVGPAMALAKVFDFSKYDSLIDIGGGSGVYAIQAAQANPCLSATIADLAPVCQVADEYIRRFNLQGRVKTKVLDFFKEDIPTGYDVALLSHIIHDWSEEKDVSLLKKIYGSLNSGGAVIISEWLLDDEKTGPAFAALMGMNMIIETEGGRNYSFAEISKMLASAGFSKIEKRPLLGPASVVIGYKR
ncbi:putative o-methyltransferase, family 2 [Candidatus Nitrososphaera gargensis Ga9.2]|uniref:Putative o-methyltransferase, family 2 n=1 Tax=Nitrososphaera gargensis (strain Ga9.2) TaxID=1237085 RepID=K0IMV2_NITGG|nr:methyltransferase [Candidatus Nitrososphaera gargensis]AFU58269.1 putative o-methyltransferase, family 2 [Candidatus Nitrososphaera gargensis Ga9.2]